MAPTSPPSPPASSPASPSPTGTAPTSPIFGPSSPPISPKPGRRISFLLPDYEPKPRIQRPPTPVPPSVDRERGPKPSSPVASFSPFVPGYNMNSSSGSGPATPAYTPPLSSATTTTATMTSATGGTVVTSGMTSAMNAMSSANAVASAPATATSQQQPPSPSRKMIPKPRLLRRDSASLPVRTKGER